MPSSIPAGKYVAGYLKINDKNYDMYIDPYMQFHDLRIIKNGSELDLKDHKIMIDRFF